MSALSVLHQHGLSVRILNGGKLYVSPRDRLNDELRAWIRQHKPRLMQELQDRWNPEIAAQGYVWCTDCIHFQPVETQQAMLWRYADQDSTCTHSDNPHRAQNPLAPRKCTLFQTRYRV